MLVIVIQRRPTSSIEISNIRNFKKESKTCILYWLSWLNIVQRWEIEYKKFQKRKWYLHTMLIIMIQHRPNLTIDMSNIRKYNKIYINIRKYNKKSVYRMLIIVIQRRSTLSTDISDIRNYKRETKACIQHWLSWSSIVQRDCPMRHRI